MALRRIRGDRYSRAALLGFLVACACVPTRAVRAQEDLPCGKALARHLDSGSSATFTLTPAADSVVVVSVVDRSETPSLIRIRGEGGIDTCSGSVTLAASPGTTVTVEDCFGEDAIDYTITANVVSGGTGNCAGAMPCGLVPYVREFKVPGEVDSFRFTANAGSYITLRSTDFDDESSSMSIQVFDPEGNSINGPGSCSGEVRFKAELQGLHTALITSCVRARTGYYRIAYRSSGCPAGPEITYLGLARPDGFPLSPTTYEDGRPVFARTAGSGFTLVVEATAGSNGIDPGLIAFDYDDHDPGTLPDLQILVSRPLGNGNPTVCAEDPNLRDGVPATDPLEFASTQAVADAINDFGCHVDDGTGHAVGVDMGDDACTVFNDGTSHFVDEDSDVQFCSQIAGLRPFPSGDTIVAARVRDANGVVGPVREMVIRVQPLAGTATPTPSPSPTFNPALTATPTRSTCSGDCNQDGVVSWNEQSVAMSSSLQGDNAGCGDMDTNHDGVISIEEVVQVVHHRLAGCSDF